MNGFKKVFSMMLMSSIIALSISVFRVSNAVAEDIDAMIKRLQGQVSNVDKSKDDVEKNIQRVETDYKDVLAQLEEDKASKEDAKMQAKADATNLVDETDKTKTTAKIDATVTGEENVDLFGDKKTVASAPLTTPTTDKDSISTQPETAKPALPFDRKPMYTVPANNKNPQNRGRRPFIRSEATVGSDIVYVASISSSKELSFAKAETKAYTGTNEQNEYLFSDNLANYCQMDTKKASEGGMTDCQNKVLLEKSSSSQSAKNNIADLVKASHQDDVVYGYTKAIQIGNDAAGYEKNVLIDMQKQFAASNTERDDIQNNAMALMEQTKRINVMTGMYATSVSQNAIKNLAVFEISGRDLTNIDKQYNAETEKK